MASNPFRYGSPVVPPYFAGRVDELTTLVDRMENGINVVVTTPRRYGKTSLLDRGAAQILDTGGAVVRLNLLRTPSFDALAAKLTTEAYHLPGGVWSRKGHALPEFLTRVRLRPSVTLDDTGRPTFTFSGRLQARDGAQVVEDVYGLLAEEGRRGPAVLMLDEFQAVGDLDPNLPGLLKALADEHPGVAMVLAGSRRHLMESLVLARGAPLYNTAERLALGPIDDAVMTTFLRARARAGRKPMTAQAAVRIRERAGPVPYDIQRLAYEAFAAADATIDGRVVDIALTRVVAYEAESHAERFASLALGQRRVLAVLAERDGIGSPQSSEFAQATGYANPAGAAKALRALERDEIVVERNGRYVVSDPFFRTWVRQGG